MNKTIIININGFIFHIEEDAYEILKNYMTDVKRHFLNSADSLEITTDIENRIAEMFTETLAARNKQVIVEDDVKQVVEQMGSVADFDITEDGPQSNSYTNYAYNTTDRKLFRDPDDHIIAGVCAGLANYFGASPVWIRLAFCLFVLLGGAGFLIYVILWLVIPKAITRAERMAMKGEKLNLQGFKNNFEEEINTMHGRLTDLQNEAKPLIYKVRDLSGDIFDHTGSFLGKAGSLLLKLFGIFVIMDCVGIIIFFTIALFALFAFGRFVPFEGMPYTILNHSLRRNTIYLSAYISIIIPAVALLLFILKTVFKTRSIDRTLGMGMLVVWIVSVGTLSYSIARVATNFNEQATFSETIDIKTPASGVYHLKLNNVKYFSAEDSANLHINSLKSNMRITNFPDRGGVDTYYDSNNRIYLTIEKSDIDQPVLVKTYEARGSNYENALSNARNIRYRFAQQDSLLSFDYLLYGIDGDLWHDENIYLTLKLPVNSTVIIDQNLDNVITIQNLNFQDCKSNNKPNNENASKAVFRINSTGMGCLIDPQVKATRKIIDSLKNEIEDAYDNKQHTAEETRRHLKQMRRKLIDSLEETIR